MSSLATLSPARAVRPPSSRTSRLMVVANRGPLRQTDQGWEVSIGGLATALMPVFEQCGGVWISMQDDDDLPTRQHFDADEATFSVRRVPMSADEHACYYSGMANTVLWPVSHYMIEHLQLHQGYMEGYRTINERFAQTAIEEYRDGDSIWIHDYHLMLAPRHIRDALPHASIAHFWHIPWPSYEVFRILPWAEELLRGMLGCDLIGLHVKEYVENFLTCARELLGAEVEDHCIHWEGRTIRVEAHPIGIDVKRFERMVSSDEVRRSVDELRRESGTEYLIIGIDRLDYTKGILSRLLAFEHFLHEHPEYHGRVTFYQVATPSRTNVPSYQQLKRDVDEVAGRINGTFARHTWVPVHYRYRSYTQEELCTFYRAADVALITPLRDGMNLVTQEFIATSNDGALVLSELTGAGFLLPEALLVNPYDREGVARMIREALEMPYEERRTRMRQLKERVAALDVHQWAETFIASIAP